MPESKRPTITIISQILSQPRFHKRARQLASFCNVQAFSFQRLYYEINTFPKDIPCISLGLVQNGKYWRRGLHMLRAASIIRAAMRRHPQSCYYAMGLDCLILARLSGLRHGFFEIGDLRQVQGQGRLMALPEKRLLKDVSGLVLTSRYFYEDYYRRAVKSLTPDKVFIIDNKINPELSRHRPAARSFSPGRITIGLIGLFRYQRPLELLLRLVASRPERYSLECFGDGPLKEMILSHACENIRYHGPFKNPEALPAIYRKIDLNFVVYDNSSINVRLAIPNKIFESAFFGVPIVCCHGTAVTRMASQWGIGKGVRIDRADHFAADMNQIDTDWLASHSRRCFSIPQQELIDDGLQVLQRMLRSGFKTSPQAQIPRWTDPFNPRNT